MSQFENANEKLRVLAVRYLVGLDLPADLIELALSVAAETIIFPNTR